MKNKTNNELVKFDFPNTVIKFDFQDYPVDFKPGEVNFPTYDLLKDRIDALHEEFKDWTVTPESLASSKEQAKNLKALRDRINASRITITNQIKEPANEFKHQIDSLIKVIDETRDNIVSQLQPYKDKEKEDKHSQHIKFVEKACKAAGIAPEEIEYDEKWDNKSTRNPQFEDAVNQQIYLLQQNKKIVESNQKIITKTADELKLDPTKYFDDLNRDQPLDEILEAMKNERQYLDHLDEKQDEKIKNDQPKLVKKGDRVVDAETGEVKDNLYTIQLTLPDITQKQLKQLSDFLAAKEIKFKAKRIK